ncbi:Clp protease N-terminal domain-containing protein [Actinokineospora diospyrosa]|uniref:Clp amino terminal domain-containing protein, pathogenicity island component n=1 Tax=Actinokineospora diospyrosa TaxID=103728 RepID=A0ABT1ILM1_9PSEU|nr:Clp protease N-terminal domain-containing protein [Actinokineospora diospyrosa]MCP2273545.1 Clp amino terminal domain-containing protein, pathogenicity island component [Actinokineospora diospyrosa]
MPKVNVYLPDELADAVREAGVPLSAICQRALEQSVRRIAAIRATALGDLGTDPTASLTQFTDRARAVVTLAITRARADGVPEVGAEHLLHGLLAEGTNLAIQVLRALGTDPAAIAPPLSTGDTPATRFGTTAAAALELAVTEALANGHNYVGCEHLLLGLLADQDTPAALALRQAGVDLRTTRTAVLSALAGYVHLRANTPDIAATLRAELAPLSARIARLEERAGIA